MPTITVYRCHRTPGGSSIRSLTGQAAQISVLACSPDRDVSCVHGKRSVRFYELDPLRGRGLELARTIRSPAELGDWDISPDSRFAAIPNHNPQTAIIRIISLDATRADAAQRAVTVNGMKNLNGLVCRQWRRMVCGRKNTAGAGDVLCGCRRSTLVGIAEIVAGVVGCAVARQT
jgi:hypothetical protein